MSRTTQHEATPRRTTPAQPEPELLAGGRLRRALIRATIKHGFGARPGQLVLLEADELTRVAEQRGARAEAELARKIALHVRRHTGAPFVGRERPGRLCFIVPGGSTGQPLASLGRLLAGAELADEGGAIRITPAIGTIELRAARSLDARIAGAAAALREARLRGDLEPVCYRPERGGAAGPELLGGLYRRLSTGLQIAATVALGFVLPLLALGLLGRLGLDVTAAVYIGTALVLLVTSYLIWYEGFQAIRSAQPPAEPAAPYPPASALIAAYLPNEAASIVATLRAFLTIGYPGELEIVLAYNTPHDLPVEDELRELAGRHPRLRLLRVEGSTSKAQNINAALAGLSGSFVGVFDADHHPAPDSFSRAWRWLASGYDVVQGHCVIRNGDASWVTRLVAVEFQAIYAVAHPGRAAMHGFGIFGGSNGYWRTELLRRTRMRTTMLTEDIDASLRALIGGHRIASDPLLISHELAPPTLGALWNQRMRWAQGWFQVSLQHTWPALRSPHLSARQKLGVFHLLVWRELYPWLSTQIVTVLAYWLWQGGLGQINLLIPIFVLTTLLTFSSGPGQVLFAYLLGTPELRRRRGWYLAYLALTPLFYSGFKNLISRVAMVKEALHEREWKVTPRAERPELKRTGAER